MEIMDKKQLAKFCEVRERYRVRRQKRRSNLGHGYVKPRTRKGPPSVMEDLGALVKILTELEGKDK